MFHMYEIDKALKESCLLKEEYRKSIIYADFLKEELNCKYDTIIGNPPYIKLPGGNLYLNFIQKCFALLKDKGELIFIVPSNFTKLTSSKNLINKMLEEGNFTHIIHPNIENFFEGAHIDIIIFRYCKDKSLCGLNTLFNGKEKRIVAVEGILTFEAPLTEGQESLTALKMPELRLRNLKIPELRLGSLTKEGILCFLKIAERNIL